MYLVKTPKVVQKLFSNVIWRIPSDSKSIFLTFDDGPIPEVTPFILETLEQYNAKGSFFCVGENVEKYPEIFNRIVAKGHTVGHHGYSHISGWKTNHEEYLKDVQKGADIVNSPFFRPPYGKLKHSQYTELSKKYNIIMWDVLVGDFDKNISVGKCYSNIVKNTHRGSILVLHDNLKTKGIITELLPKVLEHFSSKDYQFKALDEVILNESIT